MTPQKTFSVFPCGADKRPLTPHGYKDASRDPEIIEAWKWQYPGCIWGIPCEPNGFFAVDVDPDGLQTWTQWAKDNPFKYGPCQQTPRKGYHVLFKLPGFAVPNNAGKLAPGIDLRSAGYICTGAGYTWKKGHELDAEILDAPGWLLERIQNLTKPKTPQNVNTRIAITPDQDDPGGYWLERALDQARPGNRNETGFNLALQLRDSGLTQDQARPIMQAYAQRAPQGTNNPYTEFEALQSLAEAFKGTPREPATLPKKVAVDTLFTKKEKMPTKKEAIMPKEKAHVLTLDVQEPPPEMIEYVRGFDCTDTGNGQRFVNLHGPEIRWIETAGRWYIWDGKRWARDESGEIERRAKDTARSILQEAYQEQEKEKAKMLTAWAFRSQSKAQINNMIELAKSEKGITAPFDQFDKNPFLLNFSNGTLNLKNGDLMPHTPQNFITKLINIEYDEGARCPRWLRFLDEIMDHKQEMIDYIQKAVGYSLTGDTGQQLFFTCYGAGANGKTVFLETLLNALGMDYAINTGAKTILIKDRSGGINNDVARLRGLRLVTINEIPGRGRLDEAKIKEMTGGDTITARYLFHEEFSFKPEFKLWVRTNHKPVISGVDHGIWRRVRLIPFTVTIPQDNQDTQLQEKLREEWPGILAWAVLGCLAWQDEGLASPQDVDAATQEYKTESDTFNPFFEDVCTLSPGNTIKAAELYTVYKDWAATNGERAMTSTAFGREMAERGFEKFRADSGRGATTYRGITIKK